MSSARGKASGIGDLFAATGTDCNAPKIGGRLELLGDPKIKPEKPYTIIGFPGGDVEIARCEDGTYWVHVAVRTDIREFGGKATGRIISARMDHDKRYNDEGNAVLQEAVAAGDVNHIAFLIDPIRNTEETRR